MPTDVLKVLGQSAPAAKTLTTSYTVPPSTEAKVLAVLVCNRHRDPTTFRIAISPAGAADTDAHYQYYDTIVPGNKTMPAPLGPKGITLEPTDEVRVYAYDATLSFSVHGVEVIGGSVADGTWTPTLEATTTNPSVTYVQQSGLYIKVGRLVNIWWLFQLDVVSTQGSGTYRITGIPFQFSSDFPAWAPVGSADYFNSSVNNIMIARRHSTNVGRMSMIYDDDGDGDAGHMTDTTETLATNDTFQGQGTYLTDD